MSNNKRNVDGVEVARFAARADAWWDLKGEYKALHEINPVRLDYIRDRIGLAGKKVLDVGCGGGLLSEAIAIAGGNVTGLDMAAPSLEVAKSHARQQGLTIDYRLSSVEDWAAEHADVYDAVICMELVEHVPDPRRLIHDCAKMVRPGGDIIVSTVNRTWLSRLLVIWVSEYVLGIVAKGTHTYDKFIRPRELMRWGGEAGMTTKDISGLRYWPYIGYAGLCKSTAMNYMMHFRR